jgi:hypothetical protein
MTNEQKEKQEQKFWEFWATLEKISEDHNIEIHKIYNIRQIFDLAYTYGYTASLKDQIKKLDKTIG